MLPYRLLPSELETMIRDWFKAGVYFVAFESSYWLGDTVFNLTHFEWMLLWFLPASLLFGMFIYHTTREVKSCLA